MKYLRRGKVLLIGVLAVAGGIFGGTEFYRQGTREKTVDAANNAPRHSDDSTAVVKVDVVKPTAGGIDRICVVPGQIHAYEAAELFAKVSGFLEKLNVDIGARVKSGQVLAEIYSPELHRDVDRYHADVVKAEAQVGQMKAAIVAAKAYHHATETGVDRAKAGVKRDEAFSKFRVKQYDRFKELVESKSIDWRTVDEKQDQMLAAESAVDAAQAHLMESHALVASAQAKVEQAQADLVNAEAEVQVAKANLARAEVFAAYTKITAPYDGIITLRGFHRGDFIRAAEQNGVSPILTVQRVDVMRLVIFVPDSDVPLTGPGDDTVTEIEALPGHLFRGKISRIGFSEDRRTKTMRTEVDLQNEDELLRDGMYGRTTITLQPGNPKAFRIPSTAIIGGIKHGKSAVYVVRDGKARKTPISVEMDNGVQSEVIEGLTANDLVIIGNNNAVADGRPVDAHEAPANPTPNTFQKSH